MKEKIRGVKKFEKKKYKKPVLKTEKAYETNALACGKCLGGNPIQQLQCSGNLQLS